MYLYAAWHFEGAKTAQSWGGGINKLLLLGCSFLRLNARIMHRAVRGEERAVSEDDVLHSSTNSGRGGRP